MNEQARRVYDPETITECKFLVYNDIISPNEGIIWYGYYIPQSEKA